ncbi:bifunctional diguanylate cyclase/phosphodiesterase [Thalassobacillus sp. CUG 92003]|uniref:putative bifunctional diguanylate cyclase/phosphodiesterase n=1 Tax=Thalassobacillus sp. CUG 92003 TaxID=2736641 RepID=UPI0015E6A588|nr:bifunctional diguanylate cyclase/phosphodiesterase [Thalassobacillus sp. CUG 92003]
MPDDFNIYFFTLSVLSSIVNCFLLLRFIQRNTSTQDARPPHVGMNGSLVGLTFFFTNFFTMLAIEQQFNWMALCLYAGVLLTLCIGGTIMTMNIGFKGNLTNTQYVISGLGMTVAILMANVMATLLLFYDLLIVKFFFILIAALTTSGISFSALRFMLWLNREPDPKRSSRWLLFGSVITGLALAGMPILTVFSLIDLQGIFPDSTWMSNSFYYCYAFAMALMLILMIIPDLLGESKIWEQMIQLEENEQHYQSLFYYNPQAIFSLDEKGLFHNVNQAAADMSGYAPEELEGSSFLPLVVEGDLPTAVKQFDASLNGESNQFEISIQGKNDVIDLEVTNLPIIVQGEIVGVYGIANDITEQNKNMETIHFLANYDELTELPNRRKFTEIVNETIASDQPFTLMAIEIERMKNINEAFGYHHGDLILKELVARLQQFFKDGGQLARLGGDELVAILPMVPSDEAFHQTIEDIQRMVNFPIKLDGQEITMDSKIGMALFPFHDNKPEMLIKYADIAKSQVNRRKYQGYSIYNQNAEENSEGKLKIENDLKEAIKQNQFDLYFQPKIEADSERLIGFEALVRWNHPQNGLLTPGSFIQIAEETNLIIQLDNHIIQKACEQLAKWRAQDVDHLPVSVNLSQRSFTDPRLADKIKKSMEHYCVDPSLIELELTESMTIFNESETIKQLETLRSTGIRISIDDFGTGYSSLSHIDKLPIDIIKIDQSFIRSIDQMPAKSAIVSTILLLAERLNLETIAEGVETAEELAYLTNLNCPNMQGYYFSPPVPPKELEAKFLSPISR